MAASALGRVINKLGTLPDEDGVRNLKQHLTEFQDRLRSSVDEQDGDERLLRLKIKDLAFDAEDILDSKRSDEGWGRMFEDIRTRAESLKGDKFFCSSGLSLAGAEIYGRDAEKEKIIEFLLNEVNEEDRDVPVIPIVGSRGSGKTALARFIYNDRRVRSHFEQLIWVSASGDFELKQILMDIKESLTEKLSSLPDTDAISLHIHDVLSGKRFLLVIDDVCGVDREKWCALKSLLLVGRPGNRIIVTTASGKEADIMGTASPYYLGSTSEYEGLENRNKFGNEEQKELMNNEVRNDRAPRFRSDLIKCYNGFPSHLKECFEYFAMFPKEYVLDKEALIQLWLAEGLIPSQDVGNEAFEELKSLFFFRCVHETPGRITCRMDFEFHNLAKYIGEEHYSRMMADENAVVWGRCHYLAIFCGIHTREINWHLFSQCKLRTLLLLMEDGMVSNQKCKFKELPQGLLKSLTFLRVLSLNVTNIVKLPDSVGDLVNLRYLSFSGTKIKAIPETIGNLRFLHTLRLANCVYLQKLPSSVNNLLSLETLDLKRCISMSEFPEAIGHLKSLRCLDLSGTKIKEIPDPSKSSFLRKFAAFFIGQFSWPTSIRYLDLSGTKIKEIPESVGDLQPLQSLRLAHCRTLETLPGSISKLICLEVLDLKCCTCMLELPDSIGNLVNLRHLDLSENKFKEIPISIGNLQLLQTLKLAHCRNLHELPQFIYDLPCLETLDLKCCPCLHELSDSVGKLVRLRHLDLSGNKFKEIPMSIGNLQLLQTLRLVHCKYLQTLPKSVLNLRTLKKLDLQCCHYLLELPEGMNDMRIDLNTSGSCSLSSIPQEMEELSDFQTLSTCNTAEEPGCSIAWLRKLENDGTEIGKLSSVTDPDAAEKAKLKEKGDLQSLSLKWNRRNMDEDADQLDKEVLQALQPSQSLKTLEIASYAAIGFPSWMIDIESLLPQLVEIRLVNLKRCQSLPPLGQLHNLTILEISGMDAVTTMEGIFCEGRGTFCSLKKLTISQMPNLEEWPTMEYAFPCLTDLTINQCPRLKALPSFLPAVENLAMWGNNKMLYSSDESLQGMSQSLRKLSIWFCQLPESFPFHGLHCLTALEEIEISGCQELTSLPQVMENLTALKCLTIMGCDKLCSLPEWLENFTSLASLSLLGCPKLYNLPQQLQNILTLKISIEDCPCLEHYNWANMATTAI